MLAKIAVADACALAILLDSELEHLVEKAFGELLLPRHVEDELRRKGKRRRAQLARLLDKGRVVVRCFDYTPGLIQMWHAQMGGTKPTRNLGEAEAMAQAQSRAALAIFTSDHRAGALAQGIGLEVVTPTQVVAAYAAQGDASPPKGRRRGE